MGKGEVSRKKILDDAFRLFATRPYEQVSFSLMEKEIGISRSSAPPPPLRSQRDIPKDERTKNINICKEMTLPMMNSASFLAILHYFCLSLFPKYKH